jgi:hypothetical protein
MSRNALIRGNCCWPVLWLTVLAAAVHPAAPPRKLGDLLDEPADSAARFIENLPRTKVDDAGAASAGVRKLAGKRLTLYTDLPADPEVECLPAVFDQAFAQYCRYFGIEPQTLPDWNMTGFVIKDRALFRRLGLLPADLPAFLHGYSRNYDLWLYEQPSAYYRRHLLIHEGVHGFMNTRLGSCGPPWYMEGMAELLGTHRWADGQLTLGYVPRTKEEVPEWGRVKIVKDALEAHRGKRLQSVLDFRPAEYLENQAYGWSWAAATLLDGHPRYRERFRAMAKHVRAADFNARFLRSLGADWQELNEEWQLFVTQLEYGYDVARNAVEFKPGQPPPSSGTTATVAADRGWQSAGVRLEAGTRYALRASGRYQVADRPRPWWCEPGGVSIRYYGGRPLGLLLAAVRPDNPPKDGLSALLQPTAVGLGTTLAPAEGGTLYLKINDSPAELADNAGQLTVEIRRE